ncbi:hypothetical protein N866_14280 [Actinotalea ferrariae CF5-4]|uniref:Uncharacterized protein n=1 Tax=Actinotalea ferrariae CF5-4 TaxID=948458 RepID=A0A021VL80_9CELL|nr:hypothetical protein [Actinotalea ferrariae]EYR61921.1 hypothetical protein N866_14280 [Actinotalea ferrariae CF5-4]
MNDRLSRAYAPAEHALTRQEREDANRARTFRPNPDLDRALDLRTTDPARYAALPRTVRMSAAYYANDKAAAERATTHQEN